MTTTKTRDAEVVELAGRLRLSATRLARQLRQQGDTGLSPSQLSALATIQLHGPLTLGALADHERVAPPTVTKAVTKLEEAGLVGRVADKDDRRVARVSTTKAGDKLLKEVRQRKNHWLATRIASLSDDERRRLAVALDVLEALTTQGAQ
jgi:DNA-binding MarR family transcriptional regulator